MEIPACACACLLLLAAVFATCSAGSHDEGAARADEDDNSIRPSRKLGHEPIQRKDWLKVSLAPPSLVHGALGSRLELECEVTGSPPPRVHWLRGADAQNQADLFESANEVAHSTEGRGLGKTRSRLVIDCLLPRHEGVYSCVATAAAKVVVATPTMVLLVPGRQDGGNLTALLSACARTEDDAQLGPRITQWTPVLMDEIGVDVVLPCRAVGFPSPTVFWVDGDEQLVGERNPRFKVMPNGDLRVRKIRWTDMGGYTCVATNRRGRDTADSFLYPMQNDNS